MIAPVSHLKDPDMQAAPLALLRAADKARRLAEQTGTPWVVRKTALPSDEPCQGTARRGERAST
jgi:hypothetical protein